MTVDGSLKEGDIDRLREICRRLEVAYRTRPLGNKSDPLDELIYIQLSIRTRERAYRRSYESLQGACKGDWKNLVELPKDLLLSLLEAGGMADVKQQRLIGQLTVILDRFGEATLAPLTKMTTEDAERFLTGLPGVGPKTARCVLLYSLGRAVFPVDSHCFRVLDRLGFLPEGMTRKEAHDPLQNMVPAEIRHDLHVNLVHHGRSTCLPGNPACHSCPILQLCPTGRALQRRG